MHTTSTVATNQSQGTLRWKKMLVNALIGSPFLGLAMLTDFNNNRAQENAENLRSALENNSALADIFIHEKAQLPINNPSTEQRETIDKMTRQGEGIRSINEEVDPKSTVVVKRLDGKVVCHIRIKDYELSSLVISAAKNPKPATQERMIEDLAKICHMLPPEEFQKRISIDFDSAALKKLAREPQPRITNGQTNNRILPKTFGQIVGS